MRLEKILLYIMLTLMVVGTISKINKALADDEVVKFNRVDRFIHELLDDNLLLDFSSEMGREICGLVFESPRTGELVSSEIQTGTASSCNMEIPKYLAPFVKATWHTHPVILSGTKVFDVDHFSRADIHSAKKFGWDSYVITWNDGNIMKFDAVTHGVTYLRKNREPLTIGKRKQ